MEKVADIEGSKDDALNDETNGGLALGEDDLHLERQEDSGKSFQTDCYHRLQFPKQINCIISQCYRLARG